MQVVKEFKYALLGACSAAVVALGAGAPVRAETLTDALIHAYKSSDLLEQNRALLRIADEDVAQAIAALRPIYVLSGSADYFNSDNPAANNHDWDASLTLAGSLTLYDGGANKLAVETAKEAVLATRATLLDVEQTVLLNAVQAYLNVRSANENVVLGHNNVRVITEQLRAAKDRFEVGEVTRTDVSQAESRLAAAQSGLVSSQGSLATAREAYRLAVGHYPPAALTGSPRVPSLPGSIKEASSIAQRSHPDIDAAQRQVTIAELNLLRARAARKPTLSGSVRLSESEGGVTSGTIGVDFSQTIYAGGSIVSAERQALASQESSMAGLHLTTRIVDQGVANAWASLSIARATLDASDKQIRAAQLAYDGTREEARLGSRTTLEVLDAEQELLDARTARVNAEASLYIAYYQVLESMGLLTVQHLNLGIPTYDPAAYYNAVKTAPVRSVQGDKLDRVLKSIGRE